MEMTEMEHVGSNLHSSQSSGATFSVLW